MYLARYILAALIFTFPAYVFAAYPINIKFSHVVC